MFTSFRAALCCIALSFASFSNAEIVQADWLSDGDNLAFLDTRTGMQYLDFDQTLSVSMDYYKKYPYIDGYRLATFEEANELFFSLTGVYSPENAYFFIDNQVYSLAKQMKYIMNNNNSYNGMAAFKVGEEHINVFRVYSSAYNGAFAMNVYNQGAPTLDNTSASSLGLMLVKVSDVPSPLSILPFLFFGLLFITKNRH